MDPTLRESASPHPPRRDVWRTAVRRALIAAALLAAVRAGFFAIKDGYAASGLVGFAVRGAARHLVADGLFAFPVALVVAGLAARLGPRRSLLARVLLAAAATALGYGFASMRWDGQGFYAPELFSARGRAAHAAAAGAALAAALLLVLPRAPRAGRGLGLASLAGFLAAALVLLTAPALHRGERPNLILISLDTLRRDHLGCYGYERPTTPELDRFASRSLRFDQVFTPQPWTLTAHMTMLTGLYPSAHGLEQDRSLPEGVPTLAGLLRAQGYQTLAVVDRVPLLDPDYGFARGFDVYQQLPDVASVKRRRIEGLLDDAGGAPMFLFLHFYDAHSDWRRIPYEADPRDVETFVGEFDPATEWREGDQWASRYLAELRRQGKVLGGERLDHLVGLYDAGIRGLDRELGLLFEDFERRGLFESSVILVTADHGEEFFDHGEPMHRQSYDECSWIPFLLYTPWGSPGSSQELASLVDVTPTFLELAGAPPTATQGLSLAALAHGASDPEAREVVVLERRGGHLGLRGIAWSLVPSHRGLRLYNVLADPDQTNDLMGVPGIPNVRTMLETEEEAMLEFRERLGRSGAGIELGADERTRLEDLGYTGDG